jgi:hypothetical protein
MPNHVHGILFIVGAPLVGAISLKSRIDGTNRVHPGTDRIQPAKDRAGTRPKDRAGTRPAPTTSLGDVVGIFKSISTHQYAMNVYANKWPPFPGKLWQRNYYERIIRNEIEMNRIRQYIINNPSQWDNDKNNPNNYMNADF